MASVVHSTWPVGGPSDCLHGLGTWGWRGLSRRSRRCFIGLRRVRTHPSSLNLRDSDNGPKDHRSSTWTTKLVWPLLILEMIKPNYFVTLFWGRSGALDGMLVASLSAGGPSLSPPDLTWGSTDLEGQPASPWCQGGGVWALVKPFKYPFYTSIAIILHNILIINIYYYI